MRLRVRPSSRPRACVGWRERATWLHQATVAAASAASSLAPPRCPYTRSAAATDRMIGFLTSLLLRPHRRREASRRRRHPRLQSRRRDRSSRAAIVAAHSIHPVSPYMSECASTITRARRRGARRPARVAAHSGSPSVTVRPAGGGSSTRNCYPSFEFIGGVAVRAARRGPLLLRRLYTDQGMWSPWYLRVRQARVRRRTPPASALPQRPLRRHDD